MKQAERQTVSLSFDWKTSKTYDKAINIQFNPDEVIVRSLAYSTEGDGDYTPVQVQTNMINDTVLCIYNQIQNNIAANSRSVDLALSPGNIFTITKPMNGTFSFKLFKWDGITVNTLSNGILQIMLEFVKHN